MNGLVAAVLGQPGIRSSSPTTPLESAVGTSSSIFGTPGSCKKTKIAILHELSAAITEDIRNHEQELRETYQRTAGFWRYANHEILVQLRLCQTLRKDSGVGIGGQEGGRDVHIWFSFSFFPTTTADLTIALRKAEILGSYCRSDEEGSAEQECKY